MELKSLLFHNSGFHMFLLADEQGSFDPLTICFYLGIVLLLSCVILLITPLRDKISSATQRIQGFGLNLEVSVLTLLFLISAALISTGIWVKLGSIKDELAQSRQDKVKAEARVLSLQEEVDRFKTNSVDAWVTLDGVDDVSKLKYPALECKYQTSAADVIESCSISKGDFLQRVKVNFPNINKGTKIKALVITESDPPKREWSYPNEFDPFKQSLKMARGRPA
jgi:hypothetical protein